MSEPKLIAPLLEGFAMGSPISDHQGVCCCPAMELETQQKYIVKVISVPASQTQLDALLLTGAYPDSDAALAYFKELADDTVQEAQLLQRLARLEGFCAYDDWQIEPMEDGVGFYVYLKGPYRLTLERYLSHNAMTHLAAINLGLDLCTALSACRRSGYLYVDIKPGNIFISDDREYRLGDLGFIALSSLQYASLPDKYRSSYTAPEITDAYAALNTTLDTYAVGLVLYQIYNDGKLPFEGSAPAEPLPPPPYADYEMAEIILKACAVDPAERWQDPSQMGQALVSYMQRNGVNDTPIAPPVVEISEEAQTEEEAEEEPIAAETEEATEVEEIKVTETSEEAAETEEAEVPEASEEATEADEAAEAEEADETAQAAETPAEEAISEEEAEAIAVLDTLSQDETAPTEEIAEEMSEADLSEETTEMLAHADELIAHELPEPVVAPDPIDVPIPPPIQLETEEGEQSPEQGAVATLTEEGLAADTEEPDELDDGFEESPAEQEEALPPKKKKRNGMLIALASVLLAVLLGLGGYLFYTEYYLQSVDGISLRATESQLTVLLDTDTANNLLTVYCTDTYGNKKQATVENNTALFTDLRPDTNYKITVTINGFHKLTGVTTGSHTTAAQTLITSFTAVTGAEDGSVILNFAVQGPEASSWRVRYSADGEEEKTADFTGHLVTITGLTVGKKYTFQLEPASTLYIEGTSTLKYTASNIIYAQELTPLGFKDGTLTVTWKAPEGITVNSWNVRCYNDAGFDETVTVTDTTAAFAGMDPAPGYTIEVKAEGMTVGSVSYIFANSVTFNDIQVNDEDRTQLLISWDYEGTTPEEGWLLLYRVDNGEQNVIQCDSAATSAVISPLVPGAHYQITIQPSGGGSVFGGIFEYDTPAAPLFSGYWVSYEHMDFSMCRRPKQESWDRSDVKSSDYTTAFRKGDKASFVIRLSHEYTTSDDQIDILFVIRDEENIPVSFNTITRTWTNMWYQGYGTLDVPIMPDRAGNYTVEIYYDGASVATQTFSIS